MTVRNLTRRLFSTVFFGGHAQSQLFDRMGWTLRTLGIEFHQINYSVGSTPTVVNLEKDFPHYATAPIPLWKAKFRYHAPYAISMLNLGRWVHVADYFQYRAVQIAFDEGLSGDSALERARELCRIFETECRLPKVDCGIILDDPRLDEYLLADGSHSSTWVRSGFWARRDVFMELIKNDPVWRVIRFGIDEFPEYRDGLPVWPEPDGLWRLYIDVELELINNVLGPEMAISMERYKRILTKVGACHFPII